LVVSPRAMIGWAPRRWRVLRREGRLGGLERGVCSVPVQRFLYLFCLCAASVASGVLCMCMRCFVCKQAMQESVCFRRSCGALCNGFCLLSRAGQCRGTETTVNSWCGQLLGLLDECSTHHGLSCVLKVPRRNLQIRVWVAAFGRALSVQQSTNKKHSLVSSRSRHANARRRHTQQQQQERKLEPILSAVLS
jgi:hypothetical protein